MFCDKIVLIIFLPLSYSLYWAWSFQNISWFIEFGFSIHKEQSSDTIIALYKEYFIIYYSYIVQCNW